MPQQWFLLILVCYVAHTAKYLTYLLKSADVTEIWWLIGGDKLHDSVCEDNSWIDGKFWQSFYQTFTNVFFFKFSSTFFYVFLTFFIFIWSFLTSVVHRESKNVRYYVFVEYWPIFEIFSCLTSPKICNKAIITNPPHHLKHVATLPCETLTSEKQLK